MVEFEFLTKTIEEITGITKEELISKRRTRALVELRMIGSVLMKENYVKMTVEKIGSLFNVDHSSVSHYTKTHKDLMLQRDGKYKSMYEKINRSYSQSILMYGTPRLAILEKKKSLEIMLEDINRTLQNPE